VFDPFLKLFNEGGWVLFPIFGVSILVWYISIGKIIHFWLIRNALSKVHKYISQSFSDTISTGHESFDTYIKKVLRPNVTSVQVERAFDELLMIVSPGLNRGLSTIAACIVIAPLLGLLGTISGMNEMFTVIGVFGFGNPTIMANGISMALQATLTGLAVAVAALLFLDYLKNTKQKLISMLRKERDLVMSKALAAQPTTLVVKPKGEAVNYLRPLQEEYQNPDINLAPFVDTIMILLIFFVVTANLYVETGVTVTKPKAQSAQPTGQKSILIGITREGTIHMYGRQTTLERLRSIVEQEVSKQPDISVVIISDRDGNVGRAVDVIDQCTLAGVLKISIAAGKE
jgi:biopolymer transport protein ExbD